jgi:hypothetical protein
VEDRVQDRRNAKVKEMCRTEEMLRLKRCGGQKKCQGGRNVKVEEMWRTECRTEEMLRLKRCAGQKKC